MDDQHCLPAITEDTTLDYLIPTMTGAGACTTSLVDFLMLTHNDFIKKCQAIVAKRNEMYLLVHAYLLTVNLFTLSHTSGCVECTIPITHIHRCHLMDYEHQIVSVVLSHCQYSLKVGEAHNIQYDHQALDKHILDKFIHGKPRILSDIPRVVYRKDIYTTVTFNSVRKMVSPQVHVLCSYIIT